MAELQSRPYRPNPDMACERCVFGRGQHAPWCPDAPFDQRRAVAAILRLLGDPCPALTGVIDPDTIPPTVH